MSEHYPTLPDWMSPSEVAKVLNLSRPTVVKYAREGKLPGAKRDPFSGWWSIPASAVYDYWDKMVVHGPKDAVFAAARELFPQEDSA